MFRAPGRVNLIGEHTDYNDGFVLPAAIDFSTTIHATPRPDRIVEVYSEHFDDTFSFSLDGEDVRPQRRWSDYVQGVALLLEQDGYRLQGANLRIASDVPFGAGLSSSAALEVSTGLALASLAGHDVSTRALARLCQQAENGFTGMRCGIMDQFASVHGVEDHAILLDCRSLEYRPIPIPPLVRLVICNTMVKHSLTGSEYNDRRADCEAAAIEFGAASLRDVSLAQFQEGAANLPLQVRMRAEHAIQEIERTERAADVLASGDLTSFGRYMFESHESLRNLYEVSCAELDILVDLAQRQPGVYGARMTGAGFGGCTVNLVAEEHADAFQREIADGYYSATGIQPDIYVCRAVRGAHEVTP